MGTLIGVGMTHDPALARLETDLESVRLNPRIMGRILSTLESGYAPRDAVALARLDRLVRKARKEQEPGLELALAQAVRKAVREFKSREMLPLARKLLDSQDPEAVRVASNAFYVYRVLADKGSGHPLFDEQTQSHIGMDRSISAAENAEFWREWWDEKQADITRAVGSPK